MQISTYSQAPETSLKLYPAIHEVHFVTSELEHVAHGIAQLGAHERADVKKNPSLHELQPPSVQLIQFGVQAMHLVPER